MVLEKDDTKRSLHWVLKIGSLKKSMDFLNGVVGLRVLRHEEFASGCEATCNGPYGGAWSKTMVGYGPEDTNFVLELTYNYGIDSYQRGNDLQYLAIAEPSILERAKLFNYPIISENTIEGPDGIKFKIVPSIPGRAERFLAVGLRVENLEKALAYWVDLHGMEVFPTPPGLETSTKSACIGFHANNTYLQLIEFTDGAVDHALAGGRIAFACGSVKPIFEAMTASNETVQVPPLTLPTPGKADVVVTILRDKDEYEICFVEDIAFYDLATPKYDVIDFAERATRGGDGAPLPQQEALKHEGDDIKDILSVDELNEYISSTKDKSVVLCFGASWCKNCKKIHPYVESQARAYSSTAVTLSVDIATSDDIAMEHDVSTIPRFFVYKNGVKIHDYLGSAEDKISALFAL